MNNITQIEKQRAVTERSSNALISFILFCCVWIVVINSLTCLCLFFNRKSLKHFSTLQLLSLSITDIIVGLTAIPGTLTYYITSAFLLAEICAGIWYGYMVAQVASLFHVFAICLHRFITIKYHRYNSHKNGEGMLKRILYHILMDWISAIILVAIPVFRYAKFGHSLEECSMNTVFGDDYLRAFAILAVFCITPQLGVNIMYICLFRFLSKRWNRIHKSTQSMTPISVVLENDYKMTVCKNTVIHLNRADENRFSLNEYGRHNESDYKQEDKMHMFQVNTDTKPTNIAAKVSSNAIEINKGMLYYPNNIETRRKLKGLCQGNTEKNVMFCVP